MKYTVFVQQTDSVGTIHIQTYEAPNIETAKHNAIEQVSADWGCYPEDALHVLGVAKGDVQILEWDDGE